MRTTCFAHFLTDCAAQNESQTDKLVPSLINSSHGLDKVIVCVSAADTDPVWLYKGDRAHYQCGI